MRKGRKKERGDQVGGVLEWASSWDWSTQSRVARVANKVERMGVGEERGGRGKKRGGRGREGKRKIWKVRVQEAQGG